LLAISSQLENGGREANNEQQEYINIILKVER